MKSIRVLMALVVALVALGCDLRPFPIDGVGSALGSGGSGGGSTSSVTDYTRCPDCELGVLCCDDDSCATCPPPEECEVGLCLEGQCIYLVADDGTPCGNRGMCTAGRCSGELCEPAACQQPADPLCTKVACGEKNECVYSINAVGTPCGFAGACNNEGKCAGLIKPLECPGGCPDDTECSESECNPYTGLCKSHHHGNATACESGAGHCNAKTGTCCKGIQAAKCNTITDPVACFGACANNSDGCTFECVDTCPLGTSDVDPPASPQFFCFPSMGGQQ